MGNRMSKKEEKGAGSTAARAGSAAQPLDVLTKDEFAGKGGSYKFDPATGLRALVPQVAEGGKEEVTQ